MYSRKQGIQPGPSINLCPKCHSAKDPNQSTCSVCNTRACPQGHILDATERICSRCNWVDRQLKTSSTLYPAAKPGPKAEDNIPQNLCPVCHNRISSGSSRCAYCGNLLGADFDFFQSGAAAAPKPGTAQHAESVIVQQETIGHHDKKRTYSCPNCHNRVDDPSQGKCPHCGYVGTMQYDITRKQPAWTSPPTAPAIKGIIYTPETPRTTYTESTPAQTSPPSQPSFIEMQPVIIPQEQEPALKHPRESSCPECGAPNPTESRFCRSCGHRYGTGRISRKVLSESTEERSFRAATAPAQIFAPIPVPGVEPLERGETDISRRKVKAPKVKAPPRPKRATKIKERHIDGGRGFPIGLLMAIMVVAALIMALAIFVISREFRTSQLPSGEGPVIVDHSFTEAADGSLIVKWTTDNPSTSQVMFCDPDGLCSWTELDTTLVRSHSVTVRDLEPGTTYHMTLESVDADGNKGQFEIDRAFSTTMNGTPPVISQLEVLNISDTGFTVTWTTDKAATTQVKYGTSQSTSSSTALNSTLTTNHSVSISGLNPSTEYYVKAVSQNAAGLSTELGKPQPVSTQAPVITGLNAGNRAPEFTLSSITGSPVSLSSLRGKIVMLNFWATWCEPCVAEMPYMQSLQNSWAGNTDLAIVAVNIQESLSVVESYIQTQGYTFTVLMDPGDLQSQYSVNNLPTTYFIDSQGIIRQSKIGSFDSQTQIAAILDSMH